MENNKILEITNELVWMLAATLGCARSLQALTMHEFLKVDETQNSNKVVALIEASPLKAVINVSCNGLKELEKFGQLFTSYMNLLDDDTREIITTVVDEKRVELNDWKDDVIYMQTLIKKREEENNERDKTKSTIN